MMKTNFSNLNLLWAALLLEELSRHGVRRACIAPGSRSTPLTLAAAAHEGIDCHTHFDERGLGFFALGLAKTSHEPVIVICTSGTAVANLYPAIIEARQTGVPLIVLAGDRPAELVNCGANQAIPQPGIFGNFPVYEQVLPAPSEQISPAMLLTSAAQLINAQQLTPGPVFINCPFREPFYPTEKTFDYRPYLAPLAAWLTTNAPFTALGKTHLSVCSHPDWTPLRQRNGGVIILGAQSEPQQTQRICQWAQQLGWPVLADVQSQAFGMPGVICDIDNLLRHPDFAGFEPDLIVQFGGFLVSKTLLNWLAKRDTLHWFVGPTSDRHDPEHQLAMRWQCQPIPWLTAHPAYDEVIEEPPKATRSLSDRWSSAQQQIRQAQRPALKGDDEVAMVATLAELIPAHSQLMLGNSIPIRSMQWLGGQHLNHNIHVLANRGASGIDGLLATACGCAANGKPTTLLIGDTSLLHDLNSLALVKRSQGPLIIVVINNDGGGIFDLLPVPQLGSLARDFYQMPHGFEFSCAAQQFGVDYQQVQTTDALRQCYTDAQLAVQSRLIEIRVPCHQATGTFQLLGEIARECTLCER
jgi:2-succinyl-5-enolpyruvyl-6-hydroxy-3-cyclohexene-1-carboxylate synthase